MVATIKTMFYKYKKVTVKCKNALTNRYINVPTITVKTMKLSG